MLVSINHNAEYDGSIYTKDKNKFHLDKYEGLSTISKYVYRHKLQIFMKKY